jgi:hypothetical protein
MADHASLLRQIREDARPYIEQALDLAEVFTGFRKLASENGLDWGVIKALIKAEVQDEREGGDEKVKRIIDKADFASAYADMLGLGAKMNEKSFSSEPADDITPEKIAVLQARADELLERHDDWVVVDPPHDPSTGEIIEPSPVPSGDEAGQGALPAGASVAPPTDSEIHRPSNRDVSTDGKASSAAASQGQAAHAGTGSETLASHEGDTRGEGASTLSPPPSAPPIADQGPGIGSPLPLVPGPTEFPDLPPQFDRRSRAA